MYDKACIVLLCVKCLVCRIGCFISVYTKLKKNTYKISNTCAVYHIRNRNDFLNN